MKLVTEIPDFPGLYSVRGWMGACHVLASDGEAVVLDTGLWLEDRLIFGLLKRLGITKIQAILLTHGHLDHAGNLARVAAISGAPVYAHRNEQAHIDGNYPYRGAAMLCGVLERIGHVALRYRPAKITHFLSDGEELPFWGGLRVVHLPGHTLGHCGFFSARHSLLFSGDVFASYWFNVHAPPPFLNSSPKLMPQSVERILRLNPAKILPNHYDRPDPDLHAARFHKWINRTRAKQSA